MDSDPHHHPPPDHPHVGAPGTATQGRPGEGSSSVTGWVARASDEGTPLWDGAQQEGLNTSPVETLKENAPGGGDEKVSETDTSGCSQRKSHAFPKKATAVSRDAGKREQFHSFNEVNIRWVENLLIPLMGDVFQGCTLKRLSY